MTQTNKTTKHQYRKTLTAEYHYYFKDAFFMNYRTETRYSHTGDIYVDSTTDVTETDEK